MKKRLAIATVAVAALLSVNSLIWAAEAEKKGQELYSEPAEEWIKRNENSDNPLIQAIITFYREHEKTQTAQDRISSNMFTESTVKALQPIVELGPSYTEEILALIESNSRWSPVLAYSLREMYKITDRELPLTDLSASGMKQWAVNFRDVQLKLQ
ncbi:hypothetical protein [Paenibacillus sp. MMS18-CY102]|uniref:hypothetical protein n=1 Tax=Paenibacillus sp. MMS18-CY102 TaxID=2682849 RepID=UPI001365D4F2|nr:hypothetical protein [Paenibacillus sp. MMS18-CY102]MWC29825.1 hypothetical protein [Paenibacillus sp. MMS18-CY102]